MQFADHAAAVVPDLGLPAKIEKGVAFGRVIRCSVI